MKKLGCGACAFSIAAVFVLAAPALEKPLFGAEGTPAKIEQNKPVKQNPAPAGPGADAIKNKAQGGKKKQMRIEDDPIGTRR